MFSIIKAIVLIANFSFSYSKDSLSNETIMFIVKTQDTLRVISQDLLVISEDLLRGEELTMSLDLVDQCDECINKLNTILSYIEIYHEMKKINKNYYSYECYSISCILDREKKYISSRLNLDIEYIDNIYNNTNKEYIKKKATVIKSLFNNMITTIDSVNFWEYYNKK